ncbi:MAG: hypothetical protein H7X94_06425 [Vallitaleaceae bacterium]|nr:hypothetical protein [Vallitaleaceae bacterium]
MKPMMQMVQQITTNYAPLKQVLIWMLYQSIGRLVIETEVYLPLIPYGCTQLRVTIFPGIKRS